MDSEGRKSRNSLTTDLYEDNYSGQEIKVDAELDLEQLKKALGQFPDTNFSTSITQERSTRKDVKNVHQDGISALGNYPQIYKSELDKGQLKIEEKNLGGEISYEVRISATFTRNDGYETWVEFKSDNASFDNVARAVGAQPRYQVLGLAKADTEELKSITKKDEIDENYKVTTKANYGLRKPAELREDISKIDETGNQYQTEWLVSVRKDSEDNVSLKAGNPYLGAVRGQILARPDLKFREVNQILDPELVDFSGDNPENQANQAIRKVL